jgi:hypothetical protein
MKNIIIAINKALITLSCSRIVSTIGSAQGLCVIIVENQRVAKQLGGNVR